MSVQNAQIDAVSTSTVAQDLQALVADNPFEQTPSIPGQALWASDQVDYPPLNAAASDAVLQAIRRLKDSAQGIYGITLTAGKGLGKSHVIRRVCQRLQQEKGGLVVYMNEFTQVSTIKDEFFSALAISLEQRDGQGMSQWQFLATAMINGAFKNTCTPLYLFKDVVPRQINNGNPRGWIANIYNQVHSHNPNIGDASIVKAILFTLSRDHQASANAWLAGQRLEANVAEGLGLPCSIVEISQDANLFAIGCQLLNTIGRYYPVLICFDQLERSVDGNDFDATSRAVASLGKDLLNSLRRGVVLTAMHPSTWNQQIKTMPQSESVIDCIGQEMLDLEPLHARNIVDFVQHWLTHFYAKSNITPPNALYPFQACDLIKLGEQHPTCYEALNDCKSIFLQRQSATALKPGTQPISVDPMKPVEATTEPTDLAARDGSAKWIHTIAALAAQSYATQRDRQIAIQAGTDFERTAKRALEFLGFTVTQEHQEAASGLDFYCSAPFVVFGECKAGETIASGSVGRLIKLASLHDVLGKQFVDAKKLIIGPGKPAPDVMSAAIKLKVSILTPTALQKLVEVYAKHPGAMHLPDLAEYLVPGVIDGEIDQFIQNEMLRKINRRSHILAFVKAHLSRENILSESVANLWAAYQPSGNPHRLVDQEFYYLLIELASPLTGYLRRKPADVWFSDRFSYVRDL